jgi:inorganic pyrophosphatase
MTVANLEHLETWDGESGALNVVVETAKGSRNKLRYDGEQGVFELAKVLPRGLIFPFDFGFIPSTLGEDGDPIDILVLLDESVPAGCKVPSRLIGVIEAKQTEDGKTERNDRLIAVAECYGEHEGIRSLDDLNASIVKEVEHFFASYNQLAGKRFEPIGRHGPDEARKLVEQGERRFREARGRRE